MRARKCDRCGNFLKNHLTDGAALSAESLIWIQMQF